MNAGRELDALVAEKVMGWADFWSWNGFLYGYPPNEQAMGIDGERAPVPAYSTDIAAAWKIVEKFRASGYAVQIYASYERGPYIVDIKGDIEFGIVSAEESAAPHAICLAALKAVEGSTS